MYQERGEAAGRGEREAGEGQGHAERRVVQAGARLGPGGSHHHDHQGADPDGQYPAQQRLTAGPGLPQGRQRRREDPDAGGADDGAADGRT